MRKTNKFKGLGTWIFKLLLIYGLLVIAICQIEFTLTISKKKTGIIQNLTNIADNVYSGYKSLSGGLK